jgi:sugar phosphate isomerase/epimerase
VVVIERSIAVQLAASTRSLWDLSFPDACIQLQELGYDSVEICLDERLDHLKPSRVIDDPESVSLQMKDASRLAASSVFLEGETDQATFEGVVNLARHLRVAQLTIEASPRGTPFNAEVDRLRECHVICHRAGVRLGILTQAGRLTDDPHTSVELCQAAPGVGITLDPSYFICRPGSALDFDVVFPHVLHVHLRDTSRTELQVPAGLGEVDYNRLITLLRQHNFRRTMSVDLFPKTLAGEDRLRELRKLRLLLTSML